MIHLTAGCKVNLGLHVVGVRADGYHELDSLFYPLPTPCDHLEIRETGRQGIVLRCDEPGVNPEHNTLTRAYAAFVKETGGAPGIAVHLRKGIPLGSGLGGGSSDAASLLLWLNERADLPLDAAGLARAALAVGADAPFFLYNQPCRVQGIGEILTPMDYDFSGLRLVLVCPEIHVDTAWAFARYDALFPHADRTAAQNSLTKSPCEANGTFLSGAGNATWSVGYPQRFGSRGFSPVSATGRHQGGSFAPWGRHGLHERQRFQRAGPVQPRGGGQSGRRRSGPARGKAACLPASSGEYWDVAKW